MAIYKFIDAIYNSTKGSECSINKKIDLNSEKYVGYYSNFLLLNEPNEKNKNYEFVELINPRIMQGVPLYTAAFLEQIIKKDSNNDVSINYEHKVFGKTYSQESKADFSSDSIVLFVAIAYAIIPANIINNIVRERVNYSKHLMKLSGMNIIAYWVVNFIYEIIQFYFTGGLCLLILYLFNFYEYFSVYFCLLYGPSLILMTYVISFLFTDESDAQFLVILLHSLFGALGSTLVLYFRGVEKTKTLGKVLEFFLCLVPSFSFCISYNISRNFWVVAGMDFSDELIDFRCDFNNKMIREFLILLGPLLFLIYDIIIYLIILIFIEMFYNQEFCRKNQIKLINNDTQRDSGVIKEELRAQTEKNNGINNDNNNGLININKDNKYVIRIKNLHKEYISSLYNLFFCCKKNKSKIVIKNLSFCLEKGECFGLLGLNGAGKTTTFKCITQEINPSNGEIFLNGRKTNYNFERIINKFGYCPQCDAIFEYMTVYENIEFYARLKGVKRDYMTQIINSVIYEMKLDEYKKKLAGNLSGGNKRKLSFAISILCSPPIILLDEPSKGMDPESKRLMWSIIHKLSTKAKKSSITLNLINYIYLYYNI